jgi:S1-C subfamily serine protease
VTARVLGVGAALVAVAVAAIAPAARRDPKALIRATEPGVVMVLVADVVDGELVARSSGSGTVVTRDGAVLTAAHVLLDEAAGGRPHDLFLVGRFRGEGAEPELLCGGLPGAARRLDAVDLALIACDRDLNGQPWSAGRWPAVPLGRSENVTPGAQIWVLGYGGLGGVKMHASAGLVSGWTGELGGAGRRDFMRTDATVAPGSSGGAAVDESGRLIGVPTAYRPLTATQGRISVPLGQVGLIRPIELARDLLAVAQAGFTPVRGATEVPAGGAVDDGAPEAVMLRGRVVEAAGHRPIVGARVLVLRGAFDLDDGGGLSRAIGVGTTDGDGVFLVDPPIPRGGPYSVAVLGRGFRPLVGDRILAVAPDSPHVFEPWQAFELTRSVDDFDPH